MDEPLGYHIYDSETRQWFVARLHDVLEWSSSFHDAADFDSLEAANKQCAALDLATGKALYVMACMPTAS